MRGKMLVWALAGVVLTGCKVEISVPEGGSVMSSTGLYGCSSGEVCTINVDHSYFDESFEALPDTGYEFSGWEKIPGGFCGGTSSLCDLATTAFAKYPDLMAILGRDTLFTMSPVFVKSNAGSPVPDSVWMVRSNQVVQNYLIEGDNRSQLTQEMRAMHDRWDEEELGMMLDMDSSQGMNSSQGMQGNQGSPDDHGTPGAEGIHGIRDAQEMLGLSGDGGLHGVRTDSDSEVYGRSQWDFRYNYRYEADANNIMCHVISGEIEFDFETAMPQVANFEGKTANLQKRWMRYHDGLAAHQAGHQEIFREMVQELPAAMDGIGEVACDDLASVLEGVASEVSMRIQQRSEDYDVETSHGAFTTSAF